MSPHSVMFRNTEVVTTRSSMPVNSSVARLASTSDANEVRDSYSFAKRITFDASCANITSTEAVPNVIGLHAMTRLVHHRRLCRKRLNARSRIRARRLIDDALTTIIEYNTGSFLPKTATSQQRDVSAAVLRYRPRATVTALDSPV